MLLELLVALEAQVGRSLDAERLAQVNSVTEVEAIVRETRDARKLASTGEIESEQQKPLEIPPALRDAAMHWMGLAQMGFYDKVLRTKVTGRAFIPHNRSTIVAANHASHLDMGLVKYALGGLRQRFGVTRGAGLLLRGQPLPQSVLRELHQSGADDAHWIAAASPAPSWRFAGAR